jgi:hypothetical protein
MKKIGFVFILSVFVSGTTLGQLNKKEMHQNKALECKTCHTCEQPTKDNPCLIDCPRFKMTTIHFSPNEGPEVVTISELSNLYVPVIFSHKLHAQMSEYSGGCVVCHHNSQAVEIVACKECHLHKPSLTDLSKPALKGAYHRQCLGCHREWSHTTKCAICHSLKSADKQLAATKDKTDIVGTEHPPIKEPGKVVYETDSDEGKFVTFFHDEHVKVFGFTCVNCHQQESCGRCHDLNKEKFSEQKIISNFEEEEKSFEEIHESCFSCHVDNNCDRCHGENPRNRFSHAISTGWDLQNYHQKTTCRQCHGDKNQFTKLNKNCTQCHKNWEVGTFNHKITGLVLDEVHIEADCESCHLERNFAVKPTCENCHDDKVYPKDKPGIVLKKKK